MPPEYVTYKRLRLCLFTACLTLGLIKAWTFRYYVTADTVSYADLASAICGGHFAEAFNTYWGPLLPILAAMAKLVLGKTNTFIALHFVTSVIFLMCLAAFDWFWTGLRETEGENLASRLPRIWLIAGYSIFILSFISLVPNVTPDIMVAAVLFVLGGIFVRSARFKNSLSDALVVGAVAAIGYWAKSIMFPIGLLAITLYSTKKPAGIRMKSCIAGVGVFFLLALPLAWKISHEVHHVSFGTSGPLNYAWNVSNPKQFIAGATFYIGGTLVRSNPTVYQYETRTGITFYPWYDPGKVDDSKPHFSAIRQLQALRASERFLRELFVNQRGFLLLCGIVLATLNPRSAGVGLRRNWPLLLLSVAGIVLYSIVILNYRYIVGFELVFWGVLLSLGYVGTAPLEARIAKASLMGALALLLISEGGMLAAVFTKVHERVGQEQLVVAKALMSNGLKRRDHVAVIGRALGEGWPHLTETSIQFEVPPDSTRTYWALEETQQQQIQALMRSAGVTFVVSTEPAPSSSGFTPISGTSYSFRKLW